MTQWTAANYLQDGARTVAEQKLAFEQNLQATKELLGGLPRTSITISGTSITPAAGVSPFLSIATPGGAASANLNNCVPTNMKDGTWMALRMANAGQVVVVKHAAGGAGQFALAGNADLSLADPTVILLVALAGTVWEEVGRFYGTQVVAGRNFYQVAGLGQNRFTGRQEWCFGAPLTAAATVTIGVDGNAFTINGSATIFGFSAAPPGTLITVFFNNAPLLVNNNSTFQLGGFDIQTTAGQMMQFIVVGAGAWRLVGGGSGGQSVVTLARWPPAQFTTTTWPYSYLVPANTLTSLRRLTFVAEVQVLDNSPGGFGTPFNNYIDVYLLYGAQSFYMHRIWTGFFIPGTEPANQYVTLASPGVGGLLTATLADAGSGVLIFASSWGTPSRMTAQGILGASVYDPAYSAYRSFNENVTIAQPFAVGIGIANPQNQTTVIMGHAGLTLE